MRVHKIYVTIRRQLKQENMEFQKKLAATLIYIACTHM